MLFLRIALVLNATIIFASALVGAYDPGWIGRPEWGTIFIVSAIILGLALLWMGRRGLLDRLLSWPCILPILLILSFFIRFSFWVHDESNPIGDAGMYLKEGFHFFKTGYFPAHRVPGLFILVAILNKLHLPPLETFKLLNVLVSTGITWLLYRWMLMLKRPKLGLAAAAIWTFWPATVTHTAYTGTETFGAALFVLFAMVITQIELQPNSWRWPIRLGILNGALFYIRPETQPLTFGVAVLALMAAKKDEWKARALRYGTAVIVAFVLTLPMGVWNLAVYRDFKIGTYGMGVALLPANHTGATGTHEREFPRPKPVHKEKWPFYIPSVNKENTAFALKWIREHPGEFLMLIPKKFYHLYASNHTFSRYMINTDPFAKAHRYLIISLLETYYLFVVFLAFLGVFWVKGWSRALLFALAAGFLFRLVLHTVFHAEERYALMLYPMLCVLAANALIRSELQDSPSTDTTDQISA